MAEKKESAPTTQRTKTIWSIVAGVAGFALTALVVVLTGGKRGGKA
jgi:hypothetical protein